MDTRKAPVDLLLADNSSIGGPDNVQAAVQICCNHSAAIAAYRQAAIRSDHNLSVTRGIRRKVSQREMTSAAYNRDGLRLIVYGKAQSVTVQFRGFSQGLPGLGVEQRHPATLAESGNNPAVPSFTQGTDLPSKIELRRYGLLGIDGPQPRHAVAANC